jgi:hypothetical protein
MCVLNGLMIKKGSWFMEDYIHFDSDKNKYVAKDKSNKRKVDRKTEKQIIKKEFENEL